MPPTAMKHIAADFSAEGLPLVPGEPGFEGQWDYWDAGPGSEVFSHRSRALILKYYTARKASHWLRPPHLRAWRRSEQLVRLGFAAPRCLMVGKYRGIQMAVYERAEGIAFGAALRWALAESHLHDWRDELCRSVGETIGALHDKRIVHGDLRHGNILVFPEARVRFCFIDNERTRRVLWRPEHEFVRNLSQINMMSETSIASSAREAMNSAYLARSGASPERLQKALQLARKRMKLGDPLTVCPPSVQPWREALLADMARATPPE